VSHTRKKKKKSYHVDGGLERLVPAEAEVTVEQ
jgi:hypothetical protein